MRKGAHLSHESLIWGNTLHRKMTDPTSARAVADASKRIVDEPTGRLVQLSDEMFEKVTKYVR